MSAVSELPDESWSEEKILELLDSNISGSSARKEVRVVCLDMLRKIGTIKRIDEVMDILLKLARYHGRSTPESSMIVELISRLANLEETAFKKLLGKMISVQDDLLYCFARIIRNLEVEKKKESMPRLLQFLMSYDSFTNITEEMYHSLVTMYDENINKEIVKMCRPYLRTAENVKLVYAVKITSRLASEFLSELELVMERALNGWYNGHNEKILKDVCNYFGRTKDKKSIPLLLQVLKLESHDIKEVASKALASIIDSHPKAINQVWHFLEKDTECYPAILMTFAKMESSIELDKLLSVIDIDLSKWRPKEALKTIILKAGTQAKPLLFEMIKDKDENKYKFALQCLKEIGVSIEEYSRVFKKHPILQIYEFFHGKRRDMLLENLWKQQDKLRNPIKGAQMDRFEYFIHHFFSTLGFVTLFVDPSGRKGVDLVAFHPNKPHILIIGCTTGVIKEDLQRINNTLLDMEEALEELFAKHRILPIVITSKKTMFAPADLEFAGKNGIAILKQEETTTLLEMLRTNRTSVEIIKQIELSIPIPEAGNPYK